MSDHAHPTVPHDDVAMAPPTDERNPALIDAEHAFVITMIGAALFISPRTAEHHVQHIYAKIGVSTRAGAAVFAMEHGLLRD